MDEDPQPHLISYAQNAEDIVLARALPDATGFYVDIGAYHPVLDSVTKLFYDRGWRGLNVDPLVEAIDEFDLQRPRDINIRAAVTNRSGEVDMWVAPDSMFGHTTVASDVAEAHRLYGYPFTQRRVRAMTLAELCETYVPSETTIDFMKIDVEGHEEEVLESSDWERWHPRLVVVEVSAPFRSQEPSLRVLEEHGYRAVLFDGLNRFLVREDEQELAAKVAAPANITDGYKMATTAALEVEYLRVSAYVSEVEAYNARLEDRIHWLEARLRQATSSPPSAR